MCANHDYQLLDFGDGRKLERFGPRVLDRPSPAARSERQRGELWSEASAKYVREEHQDGRWVCASPLEQSWTLRFGRLVLELKLTESGQVGVFPEQAENWLWIEREVRRAIEARGHCKVLNLFAYSGASTLAAAGAGAEVVHVDAAASVVAWARRNAQLNKQDHLPVRWIVEDAPEFVRRELKRGNRYDAVILDPPAYGHGPRGQTWKLDSHLDELLAACRELCSEQAQFMLLTCHSGALARAGELREHVLGNQAGWRAAGELVSSDLWLVSLAGQRLHCGAAVRLGAT